MTWQALPNNPIEDDQYEVFDEANAPRAVARINGSPYQLNAFDVTLNAHGATDTASITLPIKSNPDFSIELFRGAAQSSVGGVNFNSTDDNSPVYAEIFVGFPASLGPSTDLNGLTRIFYGIVDQYSGHFTSDRVEFACRSLAAPLVAQKIQTLAMGFTTVQFIDAVAAQFGLQAVTMLGQAPLTVQEVLGAMNVGGANFSAAVHGLRIWDLIIDCAQFDDVDVWVDGDTLYYAAPNLIERITVDCKYGRDIAIDDGLIGTHSIQFSDNVEVEVRTYQPRVRTSSAVRVSTNPDGGVNITQVTKQTTSSPQFGTSGSVTQTVGPTGTVTTSSSSTGGSFSSGFTSPGSESGKERYIYYLKNASPATANQYANAKWRQISQQERLIQMRMPFTKAKFGQISRTSLLRLHGCPYSLFNDTYWPRRTTLRGSVDEAWIWEFDAVNHTLPQGGV